MSADMGADESAGVSASHVLGPMPGGRRMRVLDELVVRAPVERIFALAADVVRWPDHLPHYRFVRFRERDDNGGGIVEMSANRQFGAVNWPTWWCSTMQILPYAPAVRFTHIEGITRGMDVE
ncbi:MAG TPA: SRPBCC family protein, partial [Candidatus Elarobacter sp.]|nr:SRPBCC family protein [Candidatus Elarobacter sp.]